MAKKKTEQPEFPNQELPTIEPTTGATPETPAANPEVDPDKNPTPEQDNSEVPNQDPEADPAAEGQTQDTPQEETKPPETQSAVEEVKAEAVKQEPNPLDPLKEKLINIGIKYADQLNSGQHLNKEQIETLKALHELYTVLNVYPVPF